MREGIELVLREAFAPETIAASELLRGQGE